MGRFDNPTNKRWGGLPRRRSIPHKDLRPEAEEEYVEAMMEEALTCCVCQEAIDGVPRECYECGGSTCEDCIDEDKFDTCNDCVSFLEEPDCYCGRHPAYCCCDDGREPC